MILTETVSIQTHSICHWVDITPTVENIVKNSGVLVGVVTVTSLHTTASITVNENGDSAVESDFFMKLARLVPRDEPYYSHREGNSDSHVKTSLVGTDISRSIVDGGILLGTWQSIYFCEFDGPRSKRSFTVTVIGE